MVAANAQRRVGYLLVWGILGSGIAGAQPQRGFASHAEFRSCLDSIVIPSVAIENAQIQECVEKLVTLYRTNAATSRFAGILIRPADSATPFASRPVTLRTDGSTLFSIVSNVVQQAGWDFYLDLRHATVMIVPAGRAKLLTRSLYFKVVLPAQQRRSVEDLLKGEGVTFPRGTHAGYCRYGNYLIVRNTEDNLDKVAEFVRKRGGTVVEADGLSPGREQPAQRVTEPPMRQTSPRASDVQLLVQVYEIPVSQRAKIEAAMPSPDLGRETAQYASEMASAARALSGVVGRKEILTKTARCPSGIESEVRDGHDPEQYLLALLAEVSPNQNLCNVVATISVRPSQRSDPVMLYVSEPLRKGSAALGIASDQVAIQRTKAFVVRITCQDITTTKPRL